MQALFRHKFIVIGIALALAGAAWYGLSASPATPDLAPTPTASGSSPAEAGIVSTLLTLRAVKLDGTIFGDPEFTRLKDFSTEIVPEPVGRTNPFAPLSSPSSSASSTKSAQIFTPNR